MRNPKVEHTSKKELDSHFTRNRIEHSINILKNANDFVDEYKKLCHKYKCMIEASVGYAEITPVKLSKTIDKHCEELRRLIEVDLRVQNNALDIKDWSKLNLTQS